jgi:hypothetical protein
VKRSLAFLTVYLYLLARFENQPFITLLTFMMSPSLHYVLAASLRSKKSSSTIAFQEDDPTRSSSKCSLHRMSRLARLKQVLGVRYRSVDVDLRWSMWGLTCRATGAAFRFMTGRTVGQPEKASATAMDSERSFGFLFPDPEREQHDPPHIGESHPSATDPAVEPCSGVEHFAVNVQPYFVRSTASASEILTNVAIQDMLAADELGLLRTVLRS